jgi:hypothetical protein
MNERQTSFRLAGRHAEALRQLTLQLSARAGRRISQGAALDLASRYALDHLDEVADASRGTAEEAAG